MVLHIAIRIIIHNIKRLRTPSVKNNICSVHLVNPKRCKPDDVMELSTESSGTTMSEHAEKGPGLMQRCKQAIGRFIAFCTYGSYDPKEVVESRRIRTELSRQIKADEELLRKRSEFPHG